MKRMKRSGQTLVSLIYVTLIIFIIAAATIPNFDFNKGVSDQMLMDQMTMIDRGLAVWARHHSGTYPINLSDLIAVDILSSTITLTPYIYTRAAPKYVLTVTLSNGSVYKSTGSNP